MHACAGTLGETSQGEEQHHVSIIWERVGHLGRMRITGWGGVLCPSAARGVKW